MEAGPVRPRTERTAGDLVTDDPDRHQAGSPPDAGRWRVTVDTNRCFGSGSCTGVAAAYFTLDGDVSRPTTELVEPDERVLDAAELCPGTAITVRDAVSGEQLAPGDP
jgi:ferredoxin